MFRVLDHDWDWDVSKTANTAPFMSDPTKTCTKPRTGTATTAPSHPPVGNWAGTPNGTRTLTSTSTNA